MTEVPDDKKATGAEDLPEPPFEELYQLFLASLAYDRKLCMAEMAKKSPYLEEKIAMALQPVSREEFHKHLEECAARGARTYVVNRLVLGPEYCDSHPDDPRIQRPPSEAARAEEILKDALSKALKRGKPFGPQGGDRA